MAVAGWSAWSPTVEKPKTPFSAAVPMRRGAGARRAPRADGARRRPAPPGSVRPRGVAIAERLLTDPGSPLYTAQSSDEVVSAVRAAAAWLPAFTASRSA